jgi:hypothetical protein
MLKTFATRLASLIFAVASVTSAQSAAPKKDIPTIAKAAKGAIVTIVIGDDDKPIAGGTGFLVKADGAIVTNYHVIATGNVGVVKFADGTVLPVDGVLAADKYHDLAILKIHGKKFQTLTLGNSDQIQVGEEVVTIGNPLGLELTVSNGIVSGIRTDEQNADKVLQITAPISHGSSGGPLFNMFGEVVGINAMFLEGGESLNFAIPINDAKNLLQDQSAQLRPLPNERDTDTPKPEPPKPDASTALPPDAAPSREKESDAAQLYKALNEASKSDDNRAHAYYVRAHQHDIFTIEHDGRQLAATCRERLTWSDGISEPGRAIQYGCMYLKAGQHIRPEQIWRNGKELRFEPLAPLVGDENTIQVADVFDIIAEAPIGSPLRKPSAKTGPEILKTLHWIQNTLSDGGGLTLHGEKRREEILLPDVNGCQVTFVYSIKENWRTTSEIRYQANLGDLDPASLTVADGLHDAIGPVSHVAMVTTDNVPAVHQTLAMDWQPVDAASAHLDFDLGSPYAARFAKALRQAITLCGGRPSSF